MLILLAMHAHKGTNDLGYFLPTSAFLMMSLCRSYVTGWVEITVRLFYFIFFLINGKYCGWESLEPIPAIWVPYFTAHLRRSRFLSRVLLCCSSLKLQVGGVRVRGKRTVTFRCVTHWGEHKVAHHDLCRKTTCEGRGETHWCFHKVEVSKYFTGSKIPTLGLFLSSFFCFFFLFCRFLCKLSETQSRTQAFSSNCPTPSLWIRMKRMPASRGRTSVADEGYHYSTYRKDINIISAVCWDAHLTRHKLSANRLDRPAELRSKCRFQLKRKEIFYHLTGIDSLTS